MGWIKLSGIFLWILDVAEVKEQIFVPPASAT